MKTFKDLPVDGRFKFAPSADGFFKDSATYRKTGARSYIRLDSTGGAIGGAYRVGSVKASVTPQP